MGKGLLSVHISLIKNRYLNCRHENASNHARFKGTERNVSLQYHKFACAPVRRSAKISRHGILFQSIKRLNAPEKRSLSGLCKIATLVMRGLAFRSRAVTKAPGDARWAPSSKPFPSGGPPLARHPICGPCGFRKFKRKIQTRRNSLRKRDHSSVISGVLSEYPTPNLRRGGEADFRALARALIRALDGLLSRPHEAHWPQCCGPPP